MPVGMKYNRKQKILEKPIKTRKAEILFFFSRITVLQYDNEERQRLDNWLGLKDYIK